MNNRYFLLIVFISLFIILKFLDIIFGNESNIMFNLVLSSVLVILISLENIREEIVKSSGGYWND